MEYLKASLVKSALQMFESLNMWSEIIHCYVMLGERTKVRLAWLTCANMNVVSDEDISERGFAGGENPSQTTRQ